MGKKARKKKTVTGNKPLPTKPLPRETDENEKAFDFGGLPDRNLKKNLGC